MIAYDHLTLEEVLHLEYPNLDSGQQILYGVQAWCISWPITLTILSWQRNSWWAWSCGKELYPHGTARHREETIYALLGSISSIARRCYAFLQWDEKCLARKLWSSLKLSLLEGQVEMCVYGQKIFFYPEQFFLVLGIQPIRLDFVVTTSLLRVYGAAS